MGRREESASLYEKVWVKPNPWKRVSDMLIMLLLLLLLAYRLISISHYTGPWFAAFLCESWFAISWFLAICSRWTPCVVKTYPQRLFQRIRERPAIDMFVTTADPVAEPPIMTVNTVLSLLALEYPSHKLACYVSDDGCSPLILYALMEACKFAKLWVPFCKKFSVEVRAPFKYFSNDHKAPNSEESQEFKQEWVRMKHEYERLRQQIEAGPDPLDPQFADFRDTQRGNHPSIIKVIWENKESGEDGLPHLIYISREKRPKQPHHYKAGAMNVLTRVSGLMTNAPFILNVDCDMFVNNPQIAFHALCILLDPIGQKEVAFAQCFQQFYNGLKDDPYGNQMIVLFTYMATGIEGIQGLFYCGTNCFHRRKVLYGLSPYDMETGNRSKEVLVETFGNATELVKSASDAFEGKTYSPNANVSNSLEEAIRIASCEYEHGNGWGKKVGWMYGSKAEDCLTGLTIHMKGWRSLSCTPDPIAFKGLAPEGGPASLAQQKRWAVGLLEIFFSKHCPIFGPIFGKIQLRQSLAYLWIINWGFRGVPEMCYALLPVYCIITNSTFFPERQGIWIHVALFVIYKIHTIAEYLVTGLSMRAWWNNQRMSRIIAMNAWLFAVLRIILKFLGLSDTVFEITEKHQSSTSGDDEDAGRFTFNDSPMFIPGTTILLLHLTAMAMKLLGLQPQSGNHESGPGELFCVSYMILCYWPFLKGLFLNGKYGIPLSIVSKSVALAFLFVHFSRKNITGH